LDEVVKRLQQPRRCLAIDEAHHLCPEGLNLVKYLVNNTPGEFILVALPSLWDRLESPRGAYLECKQLTGNRLAERLQLTLEAADVRAFMRGKLGHLPDYDDALERAGAAELLKTAPRCGNMAFVRDVCKRVKAAVEAGEELMLAAVQTAVTAEFKSR
jgi:DNA transposition AAA+ family ATPase